MSFQVTKGADDPFWKAKPKNLTGDAKWKDIEDLINRWARRNPRAAWELEQTILETKASLADKKFATLSNEAMAGGRLKLIMHEELMQYIQVFYPKFLSTKQELHEFHHRFPKFAIPEET